MQAIGGPDDSGEPGCAGRSYDGSLFAIGGSYAPIDNKVAYLAVGTSVGSFGRFCDGDRHLTASLDAAGELTLLCPFRLQLRATHRRIFDRAYAPTQGGYVHFTGFAVGLGIVFAQC